MCERCRKQDGRVASEYTVTKGGATFTRTLCGECAADVGAIYEVKKIGKSELEAQEAEAPVKKRAASKRA